MSQQQRNLFDTKPPQWELDDQSHQLIATVVFAERPHGPFDYNVPENLRVDVELGKRLRLPLGRDNRSVVGYCIELQQGASSSKKLKPIHSVVDSIALVRPSVLELSRWISHYYLCPLGRVLESVIPAGVRAQAGTRQYTFLSVPTHVVSRLTQLKLPKKQAEALRYLAASPAPMTAQQLAERLGTTSAPIAALRKKGLLREETRRVEVHQLGDQETPRQPPLTLSEQQQRALQEIIEPMESGQHQTVLIHGVTGSGKTEVYIQAIERVVRRDRQAIVLVPEISLTPQTRSRFRSRFDHVAVLHSHLSDAERNWHWQRIAKGEIQVIIGARSAVFAPAPRLGLIVLDEEHDASFKQDIVPRYHARDVAMRRAQLEQFPLVLGSATPSLETFAMAKQALIRYVELRQRVNNLPMPAVDTVDLRIEYANHNHSGGISRPLHQAMDQTLKAGGQVILLLNRRGFSTHIQCPACGEVIGCPHCDISLTHHRQDDTAICHYCDYHTDPPKNCPKCRFENIRFGGLGTQRLEAEIHAKFPAVSCVRMDSDTMRRRGSHEEALSRFRSGQAKILLGTQMIAKGLDYPNVTLVGVINADTALHLPDFRAAERTFQLVTQVAGRTGRGSQGGRVLVQTLCPENEAIQAAVRHDYTAFARHELASRKQFGYPPFAKVVRIIIRGPSERATERFATSMADLVRAEIGEMGVSARILGPSPAPLPKLRGKFRFHLLLQAADASRLREALRRVVDQTKSGGEIQWIVDIDPLDMM